MSTRQGASPPPPSQEGVAAAPSGRWSQRTYALIYTLILLATLGVSAQFAWQGYRDYHQFREFHQRSMQDATSNAASQITQKLADLRMALGLFADANADLLHGLAASPNDQELFDRLSQRLGRHFPDYYGLTLTNALAQSGCSL